MALVLFSALAMACLFIAPADSTRDASGDVSATLVMKNDLQNGPLEGSDSRQLLTAGAEEKPKESGDDNGNDDGSDKGGRKLDSCDYRYKCYGRRRLFLQGSGQTASQTASQLHRSSGFARKLSASYGGQARQQKKKKSGNVGSTYGSNRYGRL